MGGQSHGRNHQMVVVYGVVFITLQFQWIILNIFTWHLRTFFFGLQIGPTYIWAYRSALGATKWDGLLLKMDHKQRSVCWVNRLSGYTSCQGEVSWSLSVHFTIDFVTSFGLRCFTFMFFRLRPERLKKTWAIASRRNPNVVSTLGTNSPEKMNSWRTWTNGKWMIYCYLCLKFPGSAPKIHNHMAWWAWNAGRWKTMPLLIWGIVCLRFN